MEKILRLPAVIELTGKTRSPLYADIQAGLFTKPVKLGARAVGWPLSEVSHVIDARISGQSNERICELVKRLHAKRTEQHKGVVG